MILEFYLSVFSETVFRVNKIVAYMEWDIDLIGLYNLLGQFSQHRDWLRVGRSGFDSRLGSSQHPVRLWVPPNLLSIEYSGSHPTFYQLSNLGPTQPAIHWVLWGPPNLLTIEYSGSHPTCYPLSTLGPTQPAIHWVLWVPPNLLSIEYSGSHPTCYPLSTLGPTQPVIRWVLWVPPNLLSIEYSGFHPTSYPLSTPGSFLGCKANGVWSWAHTWL
jgi:hypothetical protein